MGSSCKSIKTIQETNDFETPEQEGQIRRVDEEPAPNKQYCSISKEESCCQQSPNEEIYSTQRDSEINPILLNSIKYQRMIFKFEAHNQRITKKQKRKQKRNHTNTDRHKPNQIYQNLRICILTPELSSTEIRLEDSTNF